MEKKIKGPENIPLPDDNPFDWEPQPNQQYLRIRDGEGLYNKLTTLTHLKEVITREELKEVIDQYFEFKGKS